MSDEYEHVSIPRTVDPSQYKEPIASEKVVYDDKKIFIDLFENSRGLCLRIRERSGHDRQARSNYVVLPVKGDSLERFIDALTSLAKYAQQIPPPK